MLSALQFSIFLPSSFIDDLVVVSFQQKNKMKKEKYPDGVQIFTILLENRFASRQRFPRES